MQSTNSEGIHAGFACYSAVESREYCVEYGAECCELVLNAYSLHIGEKKCGENFYYLS